MRANRILMLDARNIYRKVSRAICDFSPEQQQNIAAIVWLYRGQADRFLRLVESYLAKSIAEGQSAAEPLTVFEGILNKLIDLARPFASEERESGPLAETWRELYTAQASVSAGITAFPREVAARAASGNASGNCGARNNAALHASREGLHDTAKRCRNLTKRIDLAAKLAGRAVDTAVRELDARDSDRWPNAKIGKARRSLESARASAVEALRRMRYFVHQADWLQVRFPDAELCDVEGLVKQVDRGEIESHDWSLTPG